MNRLIIIGNGFDLAHGLKTKYEDFLVHYLKSAIKKGLNSNQEVYKDNLIKIDFSTNLPSTIDYLDSITCIHDFEKCNEVALNLKTASIPIQFPGQKRQIHYSKPVEITITSSLLRELFKDNNWTDIENTYYNLVISSLEKKSTNTISIKDINDQFDNIKNELVEYLKIIDSRFLIDKKSHLTKDYINIFRSNTLNDYEISAVHNPLGGKIEKTVFLNFNYTNVIKSYIDVLNSNHFSEIQIHGNLNNIGTVVFGFGDELDRHYQNIEELNQNEYFRHIKSFKYLENSNYRELIKFVHESESLEVFVMGHSLGLSDRTMLNQVFENEIVNNIRLFFHANQTKNDLVEKSHSISRHFKNKARMRLVIEPHSNSQPMPQLYY